MSASVTNGGPGVTGGGAPEGGPADTDRPEGRLRFPLRVWAAYALGLVLLSAVIGSSYWMEAGRAGADVPAWPYFVDEATSILVVLAATPAVVAWAARLAPRDVGWTGTVAGHLAGMAAFGAVHFGGMTLLRFLVYPLFGRSYGLDGSPLATGLLYEGRKDALAYGAIVLGAWLLAAALRRPAAAAGPREAAPPPAAESRIEIRDGGRRVWVAPADVLWIEAAGNYVELQLAERAWLQRQTLAAMEKELAEAGFVRIHRSRLVNRRHVRAVESNDSGDFTVTLADGRRIAGSRRWRAALQEFG
jgi:hypothetical protein